jgi:cathepsin A (carboxypeptidase C)
VGAHLLRKLLSDAPFSPPFRSDDELARMTEREFRREMDAWTLEAQSSKYLD